MFRLILAILFSLSFTTGVAAGDPDDLARLKQTGHCPGCDLSGVKLRVARIANANLSGADLSGADLISADISGADLAGADLTGANLIRASIIGANLDGTRLDDAVLMRTIMSDTDLRTAVGLTGDQLRLACGNDNTRLPAGLRAGTCPVSELESLVGSK